MKSPLLTRIIMGVLIALALWSILSLIGTVILELEASSIEGVLTIVGVDSLRIKNVVYVESRGETVGFRIEWHCSGFITFTLFLALVFLIPLNLRRRAYWLLIGFLIIYFINILRILLIIALARLGGVDRALTVHGFAAPALLLSILIYLGVEVLRDSLSYARRESGVRS